MRTRGLWALPVTTVLAFAGVACGDSGESGSSRDSETSGAGGVERYCRIALQLSMANSQLLADADDPEEFDEARKEFAEENADLLEEQVAVAPDELQEEAQLRLDGLRRTLEGAEIAGAERQDLVDAADELMAFEEENC